MLFNKLNLIRLVLFLVCGEVELLKRNIFLYDFLHFSLDFFENFGSERKIHVEVIVKSVCY